MSEFKFACPVCGQHITADSTTTGSQIECPTCFQKIVVPQAPASADSKFILSAAQVGKPRPGSQNGAALPVEKKSSSKEPLLWAAVVLVLLAAGAAGYIYRDRIFKPSQGQTQLGSAGGGRPGQTASGATQQTVSSLPPARPIPTNIVWTMDLTNTDFPDRVASGNVHGSGFLCEHATLQGGNLTLRQSSSGSQDLGISVILFAQQGEELSGKTVVISPDQTPPLPRVVLRWKDEAQQRKSRTFNSGYALKVEFDQASGGRISGRIYVCFPDDVKSVVAGTFDAEIRRPPAPKVPRQPKPLAQPKPQAIGP
jgi:hypothetical protein